MARRLKNKMENGVRGWSHLKVLSRSTILHTDRNPTFHARRNPNEKDEFRGTKAGAATSRYTCPISSPLVLEFDLHFPAADK